MIEDSLEAVGSNLINELREGVMVRWLLKPAFPKQELVSLQEHG